MTREILLALQWLGLQWDEEPWFQSRRLSVYQSCAEELVRNRKAFFCYCQQESESTRTSCQCYLLTVKEREELEKKGVPPAIRFWVPDGITRFEDQVYGSLEFNNAEIENFVVLRSDGFPTYHLAVVVDDHDMGITHVIRGEDHVPNTPKQILLYHSFGWEPPTFAHVPLILGSDRKRLSKRHGATSVLEYKKAGMLPEAMVNYLALLGWSPGGDREVMTLEELIESFSLEGISRKSAVFDPQKLEWMNSEHLKHYPSDRLCDYVVPFLKDYGLIDDRYVEENRDYLIQVLDLFKGRMKTLRDLGRYGRYFFQDPAVLDKAALEKYWEEETSQRLAVLVERLKLLESFDVESIESAVRGLAAEMGIPAAKLIHPVRIALTGFSVSPGLFELMAVLGKEVVIRRLERVPELVPSD